MGIEQNKAVVRTYFEVSNDWQFDKALNLLSDDFLLMGMGKVPAVAQRWNKEAISKVWASFANTFKFYVITIQEMTAEDDRVSVQAEADAELTDGRKYTNNYHFLFRLEGGKIRRIYEYRCSHVVISFLHPARREILNIQTEDGLSVEP